MKKILALFLCCFMLVSFAACGGNSESAEESDYLEKAESALENSNSSNVSNSGSVSDNANALADANSEAVSEMSDVRIAAVSGLSEILLSIAPEFEKQTGYRIEADFASAGVVIGKAKSGAADLILVNAKDQEERFIEDGYASTQRLSCMYDYYVICGPENDPAGVSQTETAAAAFKAIAASGSAFLSIGDNSASHIRETSIWESANIDPRSESWYFSVQSNESDALTQANKQGAYVLAEKSTYLSMKKSLRKLAILKGEATDLKNTYSMIAVNAKAAVFADSQIKINAKGANAFIQWIRSDDAVKCIEEFGEKKFGDSLFFAG